MGGLAFRRNGSNISLTGQDYVSPSYGTMRLCVRDYNGNIVRYGFTSNTSASQYSPSFYINGTICHIGRVTSSTSQQNVTVTDNYTSSRSSEYVYNSKRTTRNTTITNSSTITYTKNWSYTETYRRDNKYGTKYNLMSQSNGYTISYTGASSSNQYTATYTGTSAASKGDVTQTKYTSSTWSYNYGTQSIWATTNQIWLWTFSFYNWKANTSTSRSTQTVSSTRNTTYYTYSTRSSQYDTSSTKATTSQAITSGHNINL